MSSPGIKAVLYFVSITGMVSNFLACRIIYHTKYMHNCFGYLCFFLAVSNFGVSSVFFLWAAIPVENIFGEGVYSNALGKIVGQIAMLFLYGCEYSHLVISFNRLLHIAFPWKAPRWFGRKTTITLFVLIGSISIAEIVPYFWSEECYLVYNDTTSLWTFADTECGRFCGFWFDFFTGVIILACIFVMDSIALFTLRHYNTTSRSLHKESQQRRSIEHKLFIQSLCQAIPMCCAIMTYHLIGVHQTTEWGLFMSYTFAWASLHAVDGIVLVAFHARLPNWIRGRILVVTSDKDKDIGGARSQPPLVTTTTSNLSISVQPQNSPAVTVPVDDPTDYFYENGIPPNGS